MLKISQFGEASQSLTLKLEGRVMGPWVGELQLVCSALLGPRRVLSLDLSNVTYADLEGAKLLSHLRSQGVALKRCSAFIKEQLRAIEK